MTATPVAPHRTSPVAVTGVATAAVASVATTAVAALGHAAGVSLDIGGEPTPLPGFGMLTAVFSLFGLAIAVGLRRRARQPQRMFVRTTMVLLALSLVPDVIADSALETKALLVLTHLLAAAIVVPALARRLPA